MEELQTRRLLIISVASALLAVGLLWFIIVGLWSWSAAPAAPLLSADLFKQKQPTAAEIAPSFNASASFVGLEPFVPATTPSDTKAKGVAGVASPGRFILKAKATVSQSNVTTGKTNEVALPLAGYLVTPETTIVKLSFSEGVLSTANISLNELKAGDKLMIYTRTNLLGQTTGLNEVIYIEVLPLSGEPRNE